MMRRDPEGQELSRLLRFGRLEGKRVLDVGCGDGDLTFQFAPRAAMVMAVDPDRQDLRTALGSRPEALYRRAWFAVARGQALPFASGHFDLAFFTSSF
jgi:ubiquinone/menaquinone biosynthesis C-methylase UbiE